MPLVLFRSNRLILRSSESTNTRKKNVHVLVESNSTFCFENFCVLFIHFALHLIKIFHHEKKDVFVWNSLVFPHSQTFQMKQYKMLDKEDGPN